jgi:hypothetical protein
MSTLSNYQLATFGLGLIVLLLVLVEYKNYKYNERVQKGFVRQLEVRGLPFLLVAYALIQARNPDRTPKNLIYLTGLVTVWVALATYNTFGSAASPEAGGWRQVNAYVTPGLLAGSFFAVPVAFFGFLA